MLVKGVGLWNVSLLSNQTEIVGHQKMEKLASESGLLRVQLPASVNSQPALIHPEMFLLMPVGFQCPTGDGRPAGGSAVPRPGGIMSASNGYGVGVELAGAQAWQKSASESAVSAANSGLVIGSRYHPATAGYLSNLVPGAQKQDVPGLLDYKMAFGGIQSVYNGPKNSPGGPMTGLSSTSAGIPSAVYLTKQVTGTTLNPEVNGGGYPMSLFHAVGTPGCDVQGIMALAEAACRTTERTAEMKAQTGDPVQTSTHCDSVRNIPEASTDTLYAFPSASSDLDAKRRGCFSTTGFIGGVQNSELNHALSLHGDTMLVSNSALDSASVDHPATRENGTPLMSLWRETPAGNDSNATPVKCDTANYLIDIPGFNASIAASPSLSSPTSTPGLCTSKKKVINCVISSSSSSSFPCSFMVNLS